MKNIILFLFGLFFLAGCFPINDGYRSDYDHHGYNHHEYDRRY